MARKRKSLVLEKAKRRLKALQALNPDLDLGNGLNLATYAAAIEELQARLDTYNATVERLAQSRTEIEQIEQDLAPEVERMLSAAATIYGKNSDEYEMVGGKKRVRQTGFVQVNSQLLEAVNALDEIKKTLRDRQEESRTDPSSRN